jgi:hypothetical protein
MAEKEFLLGNKARELLKYTVKATCVKAGDVSQSDVRIIIQRIAMLNDIKDVKSVCNQCIQVLDKEQHGFSKSSYRLYGEDMRQIAKRILREVLSANNALATAERSLRLKEINEIMDDCSLLLEYVQLCLDAHIISVGRAAEWTKRITDVKYMTGAWKKSETVRAKKATDAEQAADEQRQREIVKSAMREVLNNR